MRNLIWAGAAAIAIGIVFNLNFTASTGAAAQPNFIKNFDEVNRLNDSRELAPSLEDFDRDLFFK